MIFLKRFKHYISATNKETNINQFRFGYSYHTHGSMRCLRVYDYYIYSKNIHIIITKPETNQLRSCVLKKFIWNRTGKYLKPVCDMKKSSYGASVIYMSLYKTVNVESKNPQFTIITNKKRLTINYALNVDPKWLILTPKN